MIIMGETDSFSVYDVMTNWLTPSFIFLIVNLVIGTIAITSRFAAQRKPQLDSQPQLVRSTSLFLERVTSFGLSCCKYKPTSTTTTTTVETQIEPVDNCDSTQLDRDISSTPLLNPVESFNLGLCKTEMNIDPDDSTGNQLKRAPSLLERLISRSFRRLESVKVEEEKKQEPGLEREVFCEDGVDAKADDFIKRFKQQLRLERLDSILRYRDILHRN